MIAQYIYLDKGYGILQQLIGMSFLHGIYA